MRIISLGAGVQSTTMALMAAHGELTPMPDCAIFADTGWEPKAVYDHLAWLRSGNVLPFPIHTVSSGNIRDDMVDGNSKRSGRFAAVPFFLLNANGSKGMVRRQCTSHYKIEPIQRECRKLLGYRKRQRIPAGSVEMWVGISTDEAFRVKPATSSWEIRRWPLIERRLNRADCLAWLARNGYPRPPKSACIGCPFRSNSSWSEMRSSAPAEWDDAIQVDKAIRNNGSQRGLRGKQFIHSSLVPLGDAPIGSPDQLDMFINECEGMCGV